jgi:hypothetical protein
VLVGDLSGVGQTVKAVFREQKLDRAAVNKADGETIFEDPSETFALCREAQGDTANLPLTSRRNTKVIQGLGINTVFIKINSS